MQIKYFMGLPSEEDFISELIKNKNIVMFYRSYVGYSLELIRHTVNVPLVCIIEPTPADLAYFTLLGIPLHEPCSSEDLIAIELYKGSSIPFRYTKNLEPIIDIYALKYRVPRMPIKLEMSLYD